MSRADFRRDRDFSSGWWEMGLWRGGRHQRARRQGECGAGSWSLFVGNPSSVNPFPSTSCWSPGRQAVSSEGVGPPRTQNRLLEEGPYLESFPLPTQGCPASSVWAPVFPVLEGGLDHSSTFLDTQTNFDLLPLASVFRFSARRATFPGLNTTSQSVFQSLL